jgi:5-methylcytosine-specific restriction endonuclease McrA
MASQWSERGGTRRAEVLRRMILTRDDHVCWLCGKRGANSVDHVIPRIYGGTDEPRNLRAAHLECNSRRRQRPAQVPATSRQW